MREERLSNRPACSGPAINAWVSTDVLLGAKESDRRPVIIVSRDAINKASPVIVVVPLTRRIHKRHIYQSQVEIAAGVGGLTADSVALCEQVRAIAKTRLGQQSGRLPSNVLSQVNASLKIALDLP
jgi:mRNA interferase MazF